MYDWWAVLTLWNLSETGLDIIFVFGCTGCGKGALGRALAPVVNAEIISVDSMKVYRRMDIGTAKPSVAAQAEVRHHLIDIAEPSETFTVARFISTADQAGREIASRGRRILAVGGTALYVKSWSEGLFEGPSADPVIRGELHDEAHRVGTSALHDQLSRIDPPTAAKVHRNDLRRIVRALEVHRITGTPISVLQTQWDRERTRHRCTFISLRRSTEDQNSRTNVRVKKMIEEGLVDEVQGLLHENPPLAAGPRQALGYAEVISHLEGKLTLAEAVEAIKINTRRFAKAQRTWFKRFRTAHVFDLQADDRVEDVRDRVIKELPWLLPASPNSPTGPSISSG